MRSAVLVAVVDVAVVMPGLTALGESVMVPCGLRMLALGGAVVAVVADWMLGEVTVESTLKLLRACGG